MDVSALSLRADLSTLGSKVGIHELVCLGSYRGKVQVPT